VIGWTLLLQCGTSHKSSTQTEHTHLLEYERIPSCQLVTAAWSANLVTESSVTRFADVYLNPEDGDSYICDSLPVDMTSHPRRPETASVQFLLVITPIQYKFSHTVLRNTQYQSMAATSYTSGSSVATSFVVTYASKIVAYLTTLLLGGLHSVDSRWINMVCSVHEMKPETLWKKLSQCQWSLYWTGCCL
jgi:hypothetical protein